MWKNYENIFDHFLYLEINKQNQKRKQKWKNVKIQENGPGGAKRKRGGVKSELGQAQPTTSSSTSRFAKTHNIKLVENFKTIPTI